VLDRIEQHPDFDPCEHYALTVAAGELTREEQGVWRTPGSLGSDDVELEV